MLFPLNIGIGRNYQWTNINFNILFVVGFGLSQLSLAEKVPVCKQGYENLDSRFLLYNVNSGEGFNLRRDVYLRVTNLVHKLNDIEPWTLVLPPWGEMYHWKNSPINQYHTWKEFFDVKSLQKWIPVMEMADFLARRDQPLHSAFVLQNFADMWDREWVDRYEIEKCHNKHSLWQNTDGKWNAYLWNQQIRFNNFSCLSVQGYASTIIPFLTEEQIDSRDIYLDHAEILLHDEFGSAKYWSARRSMRFASHLVDEGSAFRKLFLDSDDEKDKTKMTKDWRDFKPKHGTAFGGPYISAHLRRRDFLYAREDQVPSIPKAAKQLVLLLQKHNLTKVFIASDAPHEEMNELRSHMKDFQVFRFEPSASFMKQFGDGGAAIVDQIICSHARYFVGTFESTFSFRIQEEREILGFDPDTTFNRLCGKNPACEQPAMWKIVYSS